MLRRTLGDKPVLWFAGARPVDLDHGVLVLALPNAFTCEWIEGHFRAALDQCAADASLAGIRLVIDENPQTVPTLNDDEELASVEAALTRQRELPRSFSPACLHREASGRSLRAPTLNVASSSTSRDGSRSSLAH